MIPSKSIIGNFGQKTVALFTYLVVRYRMSGRVQTRTTGPGVECRQGVGLCSRALPVGCRGVDAVADTAGLKHKQHLSSMGATRALHVAYCIHSVRIFNLA